jgi:hypothetical protein
LVFLASGVTKSWMPKERLIAIGQTGVGPLPMPLTSLTVAIARFGQLG